MRVIQHLLIATLNPGKLREIAAIFEEAGLKLRLFSLQDFPEVALPEEGTESFEANAREKACACWEATGKPSLGEDSGLEVDALGGRPGVFSSRFAGPGASQADLCNAVLRLLTDVPDDQRSARFRSVCALMLGSDTVRIFEGTCEGRIAREMRGTGGFGYDPIFIPDAFPDRTMAELSLTEKNQISHRGRALREVARAL